MPRKPEPSGRVIGDDCPVCGHLVSTGAHDLVNIPGSRLPMLRCPSWTEFHLNEDYVLYDQDTGTQTPLE